MSCRTQKAACWDKLTRSSSLPHTLALYVKGEVMECPECHKNISIFAEKKIKCTSCGKILEARGQAVLYVFLVVIMLFAKLSILTNASNFLLALAGMLAVAFCIFVFVRVFFINYVVVEK